MNNKLNFPLLVLIGFLVSCGGAGSSGENGATDKPPRIIENQITEGKYRAFIRPMNTHVFGRINSGLATFNIDESFKVDLYMDDAPKVQHMQAVFSGRRCPEFTDDKNKDGYIDIQEAELSAGKLLIPLDGDLSSQDGLNQQWPGGMSYSYTRTATLEAMILDLKEIDADPKDHIVKLGPSEELNLEGRVVMVMGAPLNAKLPETVATIDGLANTASLPISCGVIERVTGED